MCSSHNPASAVLVASHSFTPILHVSPDIVRALDIVRHRWPRFASAADRGHNVPLLAAKDESSWPLASSLAPLAVICSQPRTLRSACLLVDRSDYQLDPRSILYCPQRTKIVPAPRPSRTAHQPRSNKDAKTTNKVTLNGDWYYSRHQQRKISRKHVPSDLECA